MVVLQTVWAIRHKPTGFYLPDPGTWHGRGGSFVEPTHPRAKPARIFNSTKAAKLYLNTWLQGKWRAHWTDDGWGAYVEDVTIVPQPDRKAEDMEIIPLKLILEEQP